jgi:FAD/FMN-containing dehydrogenase
MKSKFWKKLLLISGLLALLILIVIGRPAFHIARAIWTDSSDIRSPPAGSVDDMSRLNRTTVAEVWAMPADQESAEKQLTATLQSARERGLSVAIAGARHSMGGHTIARNGVVIDMLGHKAMRLDREQNILHVQAGARWSDVIRYLNNYGRSVEIMQSNDDFSVGGSLSVNCHGWQFNRPPIASSVESFHLMLADGTKVNCSRTENRELFSLALGGYGLFGIILDADLHVVSNERYRVEYLSVTASNYMTNLNRTINTSSNVVMVYGRLRIARDGFLKDGILDVLKREPGSNQLVSVLAETKSTGWRRAVFRGGVGDQYGKQLRWTAETWVNQYMAGSVFERNTILYQSAAWFADRSEKRQSGHLLHRRGEDGGFLARLCGGN